MVDNHLRYPIGHFKAPENITSELISAWIDTIRTLPETLIDLVEKMDNTVLSRTYRLGGWTIYQLVHHLADSHLNAYTRFKLALTEPTPTIRPYEEHLWAELPDSKDYPILSSLLIIQGLHNRWAALLSSLTTEQYAHTYYHPANEAHYRLDTAIGMYDWHSRHHLEHIKMAIKNGVNS